MVLPTPAQYWLAPNSITLTLNANGNPNLMKVDTPADAYIQCYMPNVPELDYDMNHSFRKWYIKSANVCFDYIANQDSEPTTKYVYLRIPRTQAQIDADPLARDSSGNPLQAPADQQNAELCYPSEKIDIYGCTHTNEYAETNIKTQLGPRQYLYVWLGGIISPSNGTRYMQQNIDFGTLTADLFVKREGACTVNVATDASGFRPISIQLDGSSVFIDNTVVDYDEVGVSFFLPPPKYYDGQSFEVRILVDTNHGWDFFADDGIGNGTQPIGPSNYGLDLFYIPCDVDRIPQGASNEAIYTDLVRFYGKCSFTLTSVRTHRHADDPRDDWAWDISNFRPAYAIQGKKAYYVLSGCYESHLYDEDHKGPSLVYVTRDGWGK